MSRPHLSVHRSELLEREAVALKTIYACIEKLRAHGDEHGARILEREMIVEEDAP